jgi:hypothetical protein
MVMRAGVAHAADPLYEGAFRLDEFKRVRAVAWDRHVVYLLAAVGYLSGVISLEVSMSPKGGKDLFVDVWIEVE